MRILVVEDEPRVSSFISLGLEGAGYRIQTAATAAEALDVGLSGEFDAVLLDAGLPDRDGFEVLAEWRTVDKETPIIMLTARGDVPSRVQGLDLGADDYLPKPFDFDELLARIRAQLRTTRQSSSHVLQSGNLSLDLRTRRSALGSHTVDLTSREFGLLEFLLRHEGQVVTRAQILSSVWGYDFDPGSNVVDVYVGYLRNKLGDGEARLVETVRGGGYRISRPEERPGERLEEPPEGRPEV